MGVSRKEFLKISLKSAFVLGLGNTWQACTSLADLPSRSNVVLRFVTASDGHYGQPDTDYEMYHEKMVGWMNAEIQSRGVDFAFINGDLINNIDYFLPQVKAKWDKLQVPYYVSRGNHDTVNGQIWESVWKMPLQYSFEKGDCGFIVLDTSNEQGEYLCPEFNYTQEQLNKYANKKHLFVFMHITPYKWTNGGVNCPKIMELFAKQSNLRAIFHGHDHDEDGVKKSDGKLYFFDAHIAGSWGTQYRGYRVVEVLSDGTVLTYQMNGGTTVRMNTNKVNEPVKKV